MDLSPEKILIRLKELQQMKETNEKFLLEQQALQRRNLIEEKLRLLNSLCGDVNIADILNADYESKDDDFQFDVSKESEFLYNSVSQNKIADDKASIHNESLKILPVENDDNSEKNDMKMNYLGNSTVENSVSIDEIPIITKFINFDKLLEEKLQDEAVAMNSSNGLNAVKSRKTYLKRGDGMRRFGMTQNDIGRVKSKMSWIKRKPKTANRSKETDAKCDELISHKFKKQLDFNLNKDSSDGDVNVEKIVNARTWASILDEKDNKCRNEDIHSTVDSIVMSPSFKKIFAGKESAEQKMFDLLEKKVENTSFCSTSSFFSKVFGSAREPPNEDYYNTNKQLFELHPKPTEIISNDNCEIIDEESIEIAKNSDRRKPIEICENNDVLESSESSDTEETCRMVDSFIPTSTPNQGCVPQFANKFVNNVKKYPAAITKKNILKIVINNDDSQCTPEIILEPNFSQSEATLEPHTENDLKDELDSSFQGDTTNQHISKAEIFEMRLNELEKEIEIFQNKNSLLEKIKYDLEEEKSIFFKMKAETESKLNEDKVIAEYYIAEEKEKLQKQKSLYDRHIREMKGQLLRKEKDEVSHLNKDIVELKEQLAAKDAKYGAVQAKLRNQVKSLENENKDLKDECEKLKKENRKLKNSNERTRRLTNIKLLADINKSISVDKSNVIEIDNVFPTKNISNEMLNDHNVKQLKSKNQKSTVIKHKMRARTKSAPNLSVVSKYAKYFSEKDTNDKEYDDGYGLCSDSESEKSIKLNESKHLYDTKFKSQMKSTEFDFHKDIIGQSKQTHQYTEKNFIDDFKASEIEKTQFIDKNQEPNINNYTNNASKKSKKNPDRTECVHQDGTTEIKYSNGNHKTVSSDGSYSKFTFYNGDIKEILYNDGIIKYFYKNLNIYHTSYKDGSEILQFPDGYIERRYSDGTVQAHLSDGTVRLIKPGNTEEWRFPDGSSVSVNADGEQTFRFPNGQIEIHTSEFKKREFPDGTVKIAYTDGVIETRYANGRIRIRDKTGSLIMDTENQSS